MQQTLIEKIVQRFVVQHEGTVHSGDYVMIRPKHVLTHDNTGAVIPKFNEIGKMTVNDPRQPVFALDHNVQSTDEKNLAKYAKIEAFADKYGIDFYPAKTGIGHQIMCDEGYAFPNTLAVASDSHSNMYGGLGCLGTPIVRTDAAGLWVTGETWWQIPPIAKVVLTGKLSPAVSGKDIALALCGLFSNDEVLNYALEFKGEALEHISIEQRLTIANMTTEWGALAGIFPVDDFTLAWYEKRNEVIKQRGLMGVASDKGQDIHPRINDITIKDLKDNPLSADPDAYYAKVVHLDVSTISSIVSGPHGVKLMYSASDMNKKHIPINKAYLVSCVNGRYEDMLIAAEYIKGKKVAEGVEFYVGCASKEIQNKLEKEGLWQNLLEAGAIELPPGCGMCIGLGKGLLNDDEVAISATNRNFKGRMGSKSSEAYLGSPLTVAMSAVEGYIIADDIAAHDPIYSIEESPKAERQITTSIRQGFPEEISGNLIFCPQDNMNTDGIYPGKYTYIDTMTAEQQAEVVMENYDPEFVKIAKNGDILAGGYNFGTGSSREQAATAFKHKGIQMVIAGSFSETYKRNALNNGFIVIECADLINDLKSTFTESALTINTNIELFVDLKKAKIKAGNKTYVFNPLGDAAQRLIIENGLLQMIRNN
ncbi:MAG: homoaconitase [Candidatus Marinimicrobia bacterium]|nr:homoaconitase [Candidatus Neomarinimicrobiota bacterium]